MAFKAHICRLPTITMLSLILIVFWLSMPDACEGRPSWTLPTISLLLKKDTSQCNEDNDLLELCQRCAKATKSINAYPMCCTNEDDAIKWCKDYVYFGIMQ